MKKLLTLFALCTLFFLSLAYAEEERVYTSSKSIFLSHAELPSKHYVGQIFSLKVKAIVTNSRFDDIITLFNESSSTELLSPDEK